MRATLPACSLTALLSLAACKAEPPVVRLEVSDVVVSCVPGEPGPCDLRARISSNFPRELLSVIATREHDHQANLGVLPVTAGQNLFHRDLGKGPVGAGWTVRVEGYVAWPVGQKIGLSNVEHSCSQQGEGLPRCTVQGVVEYTESVKSLIAVEARLGGERAWGLAEVRDGKGRFRIDLPSSWSTARKPDAVEAAGLVVGMRGAR